MSPADDFTPAGGVDNHGGQAVHNAQRGDVAETKFSTACDGAKNSAQVEAMGTSKIAAEKRAGRAVTNC